MLSRRMARSRWSKCLHRSGWLEPVHVADEAEELSRTWASCGDCAYWPRLARWCREGCAGACSRTALIATVVVGIYE